MSMAWLQDVLFAVWFFLPAGVANMMPIFAARWPGLRQYNQPVDGGRLFRGRRVFGDHKTWRGLIVGVICATLTLWLQQRLLLHNTTLFNDWTSQVDYSHLNVLLLGPLFGLGALLGDMIESFFKRQRGTPPGQGWFPFDQIDYIMGGTLATLPFVRLRVDQYALLIVMWLALHLLASYIGFKAGIKERPI
jgi:CDP-2,3-bis-(O-geranylgeranyl)-sn-glycerol synthase